MPPRSVKRALVILFSAPLLAVPVIPAHAALVGTAQALSAPQDAARARLGSMLERDDLQRRLVAMGVDVEHAKLRVAALSDAEVARLGRDLDRLPAGGDALGVLVALVVILIGTDLIGWTDIFPFIDPVR